MLLMILSTKAPFVFAHATATLRPQAYGPDSIHASPDAFGFAFEGFAI